jgi:RHS repeat-associated protein
VDVPGDVLQENHFYAFGMEMNYNWLNNSGLADDAYKYNGKEMNGDFGLNWSDYGARWYDGVVGRWWSVDPLGEKYRRWSPYNYGVDNPILFIDPEGKDIIIYYQEARTDKNGNIKTDKKGNVKYSTKSIVYKPGQKYSGKNTFAAQTFKALDYVQKNNADNGIVSQIAEDKSVMLSIKDSGKQPDSEYKPEEKTIYFQANLAYDIRKEEGSSISLGKISPGLLLIHELGHAYRHLYEGVNPKEKRGPDGGVDFKALLDEEDYVTKNFENKAAIILGEYIRSYLNGHVIKYPSKDVDSIEPKKD